MGRAGNPVRGHPIWDLLKPGAGSKTADARRNTAITRSGASTAGPLRGLPVREFTLRAFRLAGGYLGKPRERRFGSSRELGEPGLSGGTGEWWRDRTLQTASRLLSAVAAEDEERGRREAQAKQARCPAVCWSDNAASLTGGLQQRGDRAAPLKAWQRAHPRER